MNETSRCGERRALNARERSGDATSGDERRRDERRRDGEASPDTASAREDTSARERQESCCRLTDLPVSAKLDFCSSCAWMRAELTNGHGH